MTAQVIDGKALAMRIREELGTRAASFQQKVGRSPGLAVILVGDDAASQVYVRNKERAAEKMGIASRILRLPAGSSQEEVNAAVDVLNDDDTIDAFLVQLPLPEHLDADAVTSRIDPRKDADGLHPDNLGKLLAGMDAPRPCTPSGCISLLEEAGVDIKGKHAVVVGRSVIVGKPVSMMLLEKHATVTLCHSRTADLPLHLKSADIVVAAVGRPNFIKGEWLKDSCAVIDVGINRVDGKLVGDVDYESASQRAGAITPVPGGVGPMTVAMLLRNTVIAAEKAL